MSGKVLIYPHKHEKITLYLHISECPFLPVDWSQFPIMAIKPIFYIVSFQLLFLMKKNSQSLHVHRMSTVPATQITAFQIMQIKKIEKNVISRKILLFLEKDKIFSYISCSQCQSTVPATQMFSDWFKSKNSQKSRHRIFEKNPIFFRKRQDFLMIFPSMYTAYTMSHTHIYSPV